MLAVVAVATAWSGYQATKWDALSDQNYSLASRTTVMAQEKVTLAWKDRLYDIVTFNGWVAAENAGNKKLATLYEHRFRPEYAVAILAWQKLDPLKNVSRRQVPSSSGSIRMRPTGNPRKPIEEAKRYFEKAVKARETGDHYVKVSVFLATLGQRFEMSGPRTSRVTLKPAIRGHFKSGHESLCLTLLSPC